MPEQGNWNPPEALRESDKPQEALNIQYQQALRWRERWAFYSALGLGVLSFVLFVLLVFGCLPLNPALDNAEHAQILALTVLGLVPVLLALALLRHTSPHREKKEAYDMSLLAALAKEIAKLFGK